MTTIEAPLVAGRDRARADVAHLEPVPGSTLIVQFPLRSSATPSYLDELIATACAERGVKLVLRSLSDRARAVADESAARQGVAGMVAVEP